MKFFRNIGKYIKKAAILFVIFTFAASIIYSVRIFRRGMQRISFSAIIDSDTGNGVDNMFALTRVLSDPGFELIGLTSVQWNHYPESVEGTAWMAHELNDTILKLFRKENIPHFPGGEMSTEHWTRSSPQQSEAVSFILKKAHELPRKRKLNIIALGPLTNIAAAIRIDSTIASKLKVYTLSMLYNSADKVWNKNELNVRNDLDAMDVLLNTDDLEMNIMPASSSRALTFTTEEINDLMRNKGGRWNFLLDNWNKSFPGRKDLSMSDVALIEAILNHDFAKTEHGITPPENRKRPVYIYTWINTEFMKIDYWKTIKEYISDNKD